LSHRAERRVVAIEERGRTVELDGAAIRQDEDLVEVGDGLEPI